jgi:predicted Fe-S protein YdhL (DUF1289 family)
MKKTVVRKAIGKECPRFADERINWSNQIKIISDGFID